ncbi:hypothetical protein SNE40_002246 [Patella caerulea]|uniref:Syndetin n=1 Tax=Patella caerulea TaxID=87958 RepID=A0AAN8K0R9_PATCE
MDIKQKLRNLIGKQDSLTSPVEETISTELLVGEPAVAKFKPEQPSNPHEQEEIIETIEDIYYKDETVDTSQYELEKLPEVLNLGDIDGDRVRLRKQLQAVSKKVSELILQNHPAYAAELQRVMELERCLHAASVVCASGRREVLRGKEIFTTASLGLLANYRKRHQLFGLLKSLHTIKTLQRTDLRLRELMEEEDYCGAIQLCLECQKAASTFRHYKCISELNSKLQDTLEMIEEQLDVALSKTCSGFDVVHYNKVQKAYHLLGKTQTAMDQLHMHFASAIHNTAFIIVLGYVELCSGDTQTNFQKRQYLDLCKNLTMDSFIPCLIDLCKALWEVMRSYYKTIQWHETNDEDVDPGKPGGSDESDVEITFNRRYVMQKLEYGRGRIWQDVQQKVKTYILGTDLSEFKLDEFIRVLDIVGRMIEIGEQFCGSKSEGLQDSLKQQSLNYFKNHHRARLDELRVFVENEGWELCPVKSSFNILQLMEFRFMKNWQSGQATEVKSQGNQGNQESTENKNGGYFMEYLDEGNPFDIQPDEEEKEDVFAGTGEKEDGYDDSDSDSDIPDELKQEYIDELADTHTHRQIKRRISRNRSRGQKQAPIVTNTTLNVLRVMGKYLKMMTVLRPISFDVITCLAQLFDFYLFTIFSFFGGEGANIDKSLNNRLRITLYRIYDNMIAPPPNPGAVPGETEDLRDKICPAVISPCVNLDDVKGLYGLPERIVAVESLVFLSEQLEFLQPFLESMIPVNKKAFLQQFYTQTVKIAVELRRPVYKHVSLRSVDYDSILQQMNTVKWDIKDIMSQHNSYVDTLLKNFINFNNKLLEIEGRVPIPKVVKDVLWEHCIRLANRVFVEGYSNAKKCSNEGRALMQLDFQQFLIKVDQIIDIKPIPEREFVETYIKAYYLPESQLESWIQDHKEYSSKQLLALVNTVDHLNRKARQKLSGIIEDIDKTRR